MEARRKMRKIYETPRQVIYDTDDPSVLVVIDKRRGREYRVSIEEFETFIGF